MNDKLRITSDAIKVIERDGLSTFPNECCGFLYGHETDGRLINLAVPVQNEKDGDQRRRFEISPQDYMKAELYAVQNETQLLGIYHSHPNHPAIASEHDLAKAMPYFSYVIISVMHGTVEDIKSWKLKEEERVFEEETVIVSEKYEVIPIHTKNTY